MNKQEKLRLCQGCRDNFYNGNNNLGVKECWMLEKAKVVKRTMVGVWQNPPYAWQPQQTPRSYLGRRRQVLRDMGG